MFKMSLNELKYKFSTLDIFYIEMSKYGDGKPEIAQGRPGRRMYGAVTKQVDKLKFKKIGLTVFGF